jgi:lipopolysaccharide transport system ATP-binding protein
MASITVQGLQVDFPIYHGNSRSLKQTMLQAAAARAGQGRHAGRLQHDSRNRVVVQALRDVSFQLRPGDRLGLIGVNGAGKTTLLRALAGIYEPVRGRIVVEGTVGALLDPNLGMNSDLTGRENIGLRGRYSGLPRTEIRALENDVEEFADLGEFLDLPVRFYSAGMVVRLGFGLATAIRPQVLLMDEWMLAGDAAFMQRAQERLVGVVQSADILVLSSHMPAMIATWCTRVMWMDQGRVRMEGTPDEVMAAYNASAAA